MDYFLEIFNTFTIGKAVEIFASISLYSFPLLFFFNSKIQTRKYDLKHIVCDNVSDELRKMYTRKTLYFLLMLALYIASIMLVDIEGISGLVYPLTLTYFGFSFGLISIEIKSILSSYKEVKSEIYTPVLKRWSFWILALSSTFKFWQLSGIGGHIAPSQVVAALDLASYGFIFISVFVFVYFDKRRNLVDKALKKSRKIVISMKDNMVHNERYRTKRNREIIKTLRLLRLYIDLVKDEKKTRDIEKSIRELELLLATSGQ